MQKMVGHFHHSEPTIRKLTEYQKQYRLPEHTLVQNVDVSWNSTYLMLQKVFETKNAANLYTVRRRILIPILGGVTFRTITPTSLQFSVGQLPMQNPNPPYFSLKLPLGLLTSEFHPKKAKKAPNSIVTIPAKSTKSIYDTPEMEEAIPAFRSITRGNTRNHEKHQQK
ncbi:Zinc finger BED domain-containing protein 4 [Eumeta japonica]|uniref:Zinc finger BED domain-containing protein 4 n=1 Tax=Eumeta variegata TaxID=151549 RepID=A0A4C1YUX9_EUMVA|nr:Zinc finger BED domain-containing protein 4 [Eumeta japonica]